MTTRVILLAVAAWLLAAAAASAQSAESEPPAAVPSGAKAAIAAMVFPAHPIAFGIGATVADLSVRQEGREQRFTLAADVLFDFDRAELRPEADVALRKFLGQLGARAGRASLRIEGHTDGRGSDAYNDRLATERARSVQSWLVRSGTVPPAAMSTAGFGKRRPVAANTRPDGTDDPDGRQRNRRVEIVVAGS